METREKISDLLRKYPVKLAYLFGSQVDGTANRGSDTDVAVLLDESLTKGMRFDLRLTLIGELSKTLGRQADVVILNDTTSLFFKYVIVKEGRLIFERTQDEAIDFEPHLLSLYFDFVPFLDAYNKAYVQRSI
jgi:predicted nucleotidyltransferase